MKVMRDARPILREEELRARGLKYRKGVGLPPLNRFFEEGRSPAHEKPPDSTRESAKERRSREYRERMKKWMADLGPSQS